MGDILWIIVVLLVLGWLFGFFLFPAIGGIIHILLVIAVIVIIYKLLTGRRLLINGSEFLDYKAFRNFSESFFCANFFIRKKTLRPSFYKFFLQNAEGLQNFWRY